VLRKILGPERDEVTGDWRRLYNEELNDLYSSQNIILGDQIKKNEMDWACSTYESEETCLQGFGGETGGEETTWNTHA